MTRRISGARLADRGVDFSLWAPAASRVDVVIDNTATALSMSDDGWFSCNVAEASAGTQYVFRIDGKTDVPDPASRYQPNDVAGASEVIDHSIYQWRANKWLGRPWQETIALEAHVGTFTEAGTFNAMIDRLDQLVETGFTAIELMPLADFPGKHNWGYDGVLWYAPDSTYGRPDDLKLLIDEAHLRGLMVFLDVVYNHFGPEGNYLSLYAPDFFIEAQTPWGSAINYERREVVDFAVENAVQWLRDYRFDGLRLDAVHAIINHEKMLGELSCAVGELAKETGRFIHLVLENDNNEATLLDPAENPAAGRYRAQWNDDYHHAWHVLLTGEDRGYYCDYAPEPMRFLARALGSGFAYQGEPSPHRDGATRGERSEELWPLAFVNFLQNHDQIGNRALGDRLVALVKSDAIEAALQITLISPTVPMLFMGEEWGAQTPFPFFCDFQGDLAEAIRNGRRKEFAAAYARHGDDVPDPLAEETFQSAKLNWQDCESREGKARLSLVKQLIAVRTRHVMPLLGEARFGGASVDGNLLIAKWHLGSDAKLALYANLSETPTISQTQRGSVIWGEASDNMRPWNVLWQLEAGS